MEHVIQVVQSVGACGSRSSVLLLQLISSFDACLCKEKLNKVDLYGKSRIK